MGSTAQSKVGYLAIGTSTAPSYPLDVAGTIQATGFKLLTGAGADKILTSDASGIASWQAPAGGSLWAQTGDDIYYNTGNVAIGTSTPGTAKLKILGGTLDMTTQKISNLATPTADADAATKAYVDAASAGVKYWLILRTAATYTGNLGGYAGANAKCAAEFGSSCVMLNRMILTSGLLGGTYSVLGFTTNGPGWWHSPYVSYNANPANQQGDPSPINPAGWHGYNTGAYLCLDCLAWSSADAAGKGFYWDGANRFDGTCNTARSIWCACPQ